MNQRVEKEQQRRYVEQLLACDLTVAEWCHRHKIAKQTMYGWLATFAETEPELFGGAENIVDRSKRRWLETTRKNMSDAMALTVYRSPGVIIVDTLLRDPKTDSSSKRVSGEVLPIKVDLNGATVAIPPGSTEADIASVLKAVAAL